MAQRPNYIDLRAQSYESYESSRSTNLDLPSPRTGDVPPALSPLDAFALQSRMLAKQFETPKNGRRISRLPPLTIQNQFGQRPCYERSTSAEKSLPEEPQDEPQENETRTPPGVRQRTPDFRPQSVYPVIQSETDEHEVPPPLPKDYSEVDYSGKHKSQEPSDYFNMPRAQSPDQFEVRKDEQDSSSVTPQAHQASSYSSQTYAQPKPRTATITSIQSAASTRSGRMSPNPNLLPLPQASPGLARSPRVSPSIRSVPQDSSDVDGMSLMSSSYDSLPHRQMSSGSNYSRAASPYSPYFNPIPRSPSVSSEYSVNGTRLSKPAFNFSRPLSGRPSFDSRAPLDPPPRHVFEQAQSNDSRSSLDVPQRQDSGDSSLAAYPTHEVHTPISMMSDELPPAIEETPPPDSPVLREPEDPNAPAPSYIYAKYTLPRGRELKRDSIGATEWMNRAFAGTHSHKNSREERPQTPPSPPRTATGAGRSVTPAVEDTQNRGKSFDEQLLDRPAVTRNFSQKSAPSLASSNATIKADKARSTITSASKLSADMTAEEHLEKGIQCHEAGSLQKSTYHLRLAARGGHPTAMLLYALACRHGWGMRPSAEEGVKWLKQAVELAQNEVADDADLSKQGHKIDSLVQKTHKAQFALGIYELGVSYMNGWGIHQDKKMALRCFEIAGQWGDADALAEAAYCYTQGIGTKKDLKKAATYYRQAEAKGMSMTGQSWIYKEKYMDNKDAKAADDRKSRGADKEEKPKKPRDKSRTRTIFGRRKTMTSDQKPPTIT